MENQLLEQLLSKLDVKYVKQKIDNVYNQTYDLTEFKKDVTMKLDKIYDDVDFIKYEQFEGKQDLFKLKKNLKVIK